eukprot:8696285-Alexandrium_andersonii.AAC.1
MQQAPREARLLAVRQLGSPTFADSEPQRGLFGPSGVLGPRPPRAGGWAPSTLCFEQRAK